MRIKKVALKVMRTFNNYEISGSSKKFHATLSKSLGSYVLNVYEITTGYNPTLRIIPVLTEIDHVAALCKTLNLGFLISIDIDKNRPHYYVY